MGKFEDRFRTRGPDRYVITEAGFLVCQDCGSLIMEGHREAHDHFHTQHYTAWANTQP